ncbi:MAG TPA: DUF3999 domain-containing protein [Povalibacter sp.]|uniref:DUF3999 domain-containing protein n=1 Tax=Povalibacter sp. TaxID=1962978 RepID=UPI002BD62FD0|nr:DUF3999 domain-containing protein [Povalibacter sp.]HMN46301.1 DUF3999 domain-containing protein [Povalibacter sp.]
MKQVRGILTLVLGATAIGAVAAPRTDDYVRGIEVSTYEQRPLVELVLPDEVYQGVTRADLGDLRVFNAAGSAVPHAFCASPAAAEPVVSSESLPVFDLQAGVPATTTGATHVEVETAGGTQVRIQESEPASTDAPRTKTWAHVIDARGVEDSLRSIEFDWTSPDGASQASVRIEASDDLDQWRTVVGSTTLLRVTRDGQQLQRKTVPVIEQRYRFLRVVRTDGGPALQIAQVTAERVARAQEIEPVWFTANPQEPVDAAHLRFDAARLAPVTYARLVLPEPNSSVRVSLESRADEQASWRARWSGEVYSIVKDGERRVSPPAELDGGHDRYWQITNTQTAATLDPATGLELGYRPARLRFLAQGDGPYLLAFGSRRAETAPIQQCANLLSDVRGEDLDQLIGSGVVGTSRTLGGETALKPLPKQTPVRLVILWGVLIVGVGLLVAMALALLKRVRQN